MDEVRDLMRTRHYSYITERTYLAWIRPFIFHYGKRHPKELGPQAIGEYLTHLAVHRGVSPSTQNQALNALVLLLREILLIDTKDLEGIGGKPHRRIVAYLVHTLVRILTTDTNFRFASSVLVLKLASRSAITSQIAAHSIAEPRAIA